MRCRSRAREAGAQALNQRRRGGREQRCQRDRAQDQQRERDAARAVRDRLGRAGVGDGGLGLLLRFLGRKLAAGAARRGGAAAAVVRPVLRRRSGADHGSGDVVQDRRVVREIRRHAPVGLAQAMLRVAAVDLTVLRPVVDHALRAGSARMRDGGARGEERDGGCECDEWETRLHGSLAEGSYPFVRTAKLDKCFDSLGPDAHRPRAPGDEARWSDAARRANRTATAARRGLGRPGRSGRALQQRVVGRPLDLDRWARDRVRGCRRRVGGGRLSGGPRVVRACSRDGRLFRRPRRLAGVLDALDDRGRPDLELRQSGARLSRVPGAGVGARDDAAGAAVCCRMARGRDGGGDRLGARDEDLPRLVGGDRAGRASEQPDRLLECARAADRVRAAVGAVDRGAARAAGVVYLYAALVALVLTFSRGGVAVGIVAVALWFAIARPRLESAAALALALVPTLAVSGWAFSRPGLTKDGQPRSLQVHDGRWFALALVLGGIGAFAAAFFVARYENQRPLTEPWRLRLGRAAVVAVVAAAVPE